MSCHDNFYQKNPNLYIELEESIEVGYILLEDDSLLLQEDGEYILY